MPFYTKLANDILKRITKDTKNPGVSVKIPKEEVRSYSRKLISSVNGDNTKYQSLLSAKMHQLGYKAFSAEIPAWMNGMTSDQCRQVSAYYYGITKYMHDHHISKIKFKNETLTEKECAQRSWSYSKAAIRNQGKNIKVGNKKIVSLTNKNAQHRIKPSRSNVSNPVGIKKEAERFLKEAASQARSASPVGLGMLGLDATKNIVSKLHDNIDSPGHTIHKSNEKTKSAKHNNTSEANVVQKNAERLAKVAVAATPLGAAIAAGDLFQMVQSKFNENIGNSEQTVSNGMHL